MTKIVYNGCYGGFGLSLKAQQAYAKAKGFELFFYTGKIRGPYQRVDANDKADHFVVRAMKADLGDAPTSEQLNAGEWFHDRDIPRHDPDLVAIVEQLGEKASGRCAELKIAEVPKGSLYRIDEYDGNESVMTNSDYDWQVAP